MSGDAIDDKRMLAVARRHFYAELDVGSFVLVRENFADVVQQRSAARHRDVKSELGSHDSCKPRDFLGVVEDVLAVARPPSHAPDQANDFLVETMNAALI